MPETTALSVLQVVRLKGRTTPLDVAAALGADEADVGLQLAALVDRGLLREANEKVRMTPEGKETLVGLLDEERLGVDQAALLGLCEAFHAHNSQLKVLATTWQQRGDQPNDHTDAAYDQGVLDGLEELHRDFAPLAAQVADVVPRLQAYPARFDLALDRIRGGEHKWFLGPIIDSYHTVWFEFHEELIGLLGRTRQDEALAGRAE